MWIRTKRFLYGVVLLFVAAVAAQPTWAQLPTPNQPILLVQDNGSTDPYQNYVPELLTTEGLNGFQIAQLSNLTSDFLSNYDVVILPHLALSSTQASLFQTYVSNGGTLVGFRPDMQLASVFGVTPLGTTLPEAWLQIDTSTPYGSALVNNVMRFHGTADLYSLSGASTLATLYSTNTVSTTSPAVAINTSGAGKAILFSFDLTQNIVLMRQGNPAWAGYPDNHDGYYTMRAAGMFMDVGSGQFWNDLGDGALNDVPQADIQLRLFSNALTLTNVAKRPLPRLWYFPNQNRSQLLMTGDDHSYPVADALGEINFVSSYGGLFSYNLWYPFTTVDPSIVTTWLAAGDSFGLHFNDTAEVDSSGVGGSAVTWNGMQSVMTNALTSFAGTYTNAPYPVTTRNHYLIWVSNDADGTVDQVANAKLFQANGIQMDTTYSAFPSRWGYMTGSGLPMKFLDPVAGTVVPVYEQATQYEDDVQLVPGAGYSLTWDQSTAQSHYVQSLTDSLTKYNTVVTMLFHPENWATYDQADVQAALQYAQAQSIPMTTTGSWLAFWQARAATTLSMPSFSSNTLTFTATGAPAGLTLLVPEASGTNAVVSTFQVDSVSQAFAVAEYQGVMYASVVLTAGTHNISVGYGATGTAGRILGQLYPSSVSASTTIQVQGGSITDIVSVASDGTYVAGPLPAGTYTVTPLSANNTFSPASQSVLLGTVDVPNIDFSVASSSFLGETLFTTQTPATTNNYAGAGSNLELGTAFTSDVPGQITGVRFWKAGNEFGTHTGNIWDSSGNLLGSVTFTNETDSGWQQQALSAPISIAAGTQYVVSVNTANSYYVASGGGLSLPVVNQDLSSVVGNNGLFGNPGQFPTNTYNGTNYFRDVFFVPGVSTNLLSIDLDPANITGGNTTTGTVTLNGPAPAGGTTVPLSATNPLAQPHTIQAVNYVGAMQADASIIWSSLGPPLFNYAPSGSVVTVSGLTGVTATLTNAAGQPFEFDTECPADNCGWVGNFNPGADVLWVYGQYLNNTWAPNGPMTVAFSSPQRGIGFQMMADESGPFTATLCAYNSSNTLLGCSSFSGNSADPQAQFVGIYDDTQEISSVTIDGGGTMYPHDFAIGDALVVNGEKQLVTVPASVTVPQGATSATFQVATNQVSASTSATISANFNASQSATLTLTPPDLTSLTMNPNGVVGGTSSTGTVILANPAPSGGAVVTLTSDVPVIQPHTIQSVTGPPAVQPDGSVSPGALQADSSVAWSILGAPFTTIPSGTTVPVSGVPGLTMTVTNKANQPLMYLTECPGNNDVNNCGWVGNFNPGANILWDFGTYVNGSWVGNGPMTVTFSSPQHGLGFQIMADELGPFTASMCAYDSSNNQLGCSSFSGLGSEYNQAILVGVYDDTQEISSIVIDGGGTLYPHDFGVGDMFVANAARPVVATVPSSVTVPEGQTSATFTVTTNAVNTSTFVNVTGSYSGTQTTGAMQITSVIPAISAVSVSPTTVVGGNSSTGTVTLNGPAVVGGAVVSLTSDSYAATVPASVTVPAHQTTANFTITTTTVNSPITANITANYGGQVATQLTVNPPPAVSSVSLNPASIVGGVSGQISTGTVTLNGIAPADGIVVTLTSGNTSAATVPANVTVPSGASSTTFTVTPLAVGVSTGVSISANVGATAAQSATLTVLPSSVTSVSMSPTTVQGGSANSTGTVTLNGPAAGTVAQRTVTLSNTTTADSIPASVQVTAGATTATFTATTAKVGSATIDTITATLNGSANTTLTIDPPAISSVTLNPTSITSEPSGTASTSTGTVTLNTTAPASGVVVILTSGNTAAATVPATVTVASGTSSKTFTVTSIDGLTSTATSSISATLTGGGSQSATLTVVAPASGVATLGLSATTVQGGLTNPTGTVTLNAPAPTGGAVVTLASSNTAAATVPASVTVAANATTATFTVTSIKVSAQATTTISATYDGVQQTAVLTVDPPAISSVVLTPASLTSEPSGTASTSSAKVTLNATAPTGGVVVTVASGNTAAATLSVSTATVPAGSTSTTFTVTTVDGLTANATSSISATLTGGGTQSATLTVLAPATGVTSLTFSANPVQGGLTNPTATVTLNGGAPTAGALVTLGSNSADAGVPASVTVAANATTATFTVTTVKIGAQTVATISATYNGVQQTANLTIDPPAISSVTLSPTSLIGGATSTATVRLNASAPTSGVVVNVASSNTAVATLSVSTVTVASGATTATFTVTSIPVAATSTSSISATLTGGGTQSATLTVNPPTLSSLTLNPTTVIHPASSTGTVTISGKAPAAGFVVNLTSSNTGVGTVPTTMTVAAGSTTGTFTVTTLAAAPPPGTITISASRTGSTTRTANLTVN